MTTLGGLGVGLGRASVSSIGPLSPAEKAGLSSDDSTTNNTQVYSTTISTSCNQTISSDNSTCNSSFDTFSNILGTSNVDSPESISNSTVHNVRSASPSSNIISHEPISTIHSNQIDSSTTSLAIPHKESFSVTKVDPYHISTKDSEREICQQNLETMINQEKDNSYPADDSVSSTYISIASSVENISSNIDDYNSTNKDFPLLKISDSTRKQSSLDQNSTFLQVL